jgi:hypothetical protein
MNSKRQGPGKGLNGIIRITKGVIQTNNGIIHITNFYVLIIHLAI